MQLQRFLQVLLFRDLLSHVLPGFLSLVAATVVVADIMNMGDLAASLKNTRGNLGDFLSISAIIGLSYFIGYLQATAVFYLRGLTPTKFYFKSIEETPRALVDQMEKIFGPMGSSTKGRYDMLAARKELCQAYVALHQPDYFTINIERYTMLINLEVSIAGAFAVWGLAAVIILDDWCRLLAIVPFVISALLALKTSKDMDLDMDFLANSAFYIISKEEANETEYPAREG